jgi:hypothetical protein
MMILKHNLMRSYFPALTVCFFVLVSMTPPLNSSSPAPKKTRYYFAAGQNTSLEKTYRATSNIFSLDCEYVSLTEVGKQFTRYYKSVLSTGQDDWIDGFGYGPYDTYEQAKKARNSTINDQNYLCNTPKCVVRQAVGFQPACK